MCKIIAVASQKGGVAKTTTVLNLATALALQGRKVLCVDVDPQGSLTICAGVQNPDNLVHTTYSLLNAVLDEAELPPYSEYIITCGKIDVIPCNINLSAFEINRGHEIGAERALQALVEPLKEMYNFILFDTGLSLGVLTVNAIVASHSVLITVTPQLLSAIGLKLLIRTIQKVQKHLNPAVVIEGVLIAMADVRTNLYKEVNEILKGTYSQSIRIFETVIHHSTKVGEANLRQQSVLIYDENSKPAIAYKAFAKELTDL